MNASIRALSIFVSVVETKSFAAAARTLLVDPAAVSRAIKALEEGLGVVLFVRSTRALKLTDEGARFYRDCVQILQKLNEATHRFRAGRAAPHGTLKVGMAPGLARRMLLRATPSFRQQYPQIEIILLSVDEVAQIGNKGIDVLIRPRRQRQQGGPNPEPQGLIMRKLLQSQQIVCASPQYLARAGSPRVPADLLQHACVAHVNMEFDVQDEWQFAKSNARLKIKFVPHLLVQGTEALREAGVAGCGVVRLLACSIEDELSSGELVRVLPDWECTGSPPLVAIYRRTRPMLPQVSAFVGYLAKAFQRYNITTSPATKRVR